MESTGGGKCNNGLIKAGDVDRNDANVHHDIELVRGPSDFSTRLNCWPASSQQS